MSVLSTHGLTVRYGAHEALSSLSVEVSEGVTGLLGPNGAGKSTLLKTVLGFVEPTAGTAFVLGTSVAGRPRDLRMRLGYFPERPVVLPGLSAVEGVALAGEAGGLGRADALQRAHEVLWFAGLGDVRYRMVDEFSTGMRQRTKLATALVHDPDLLLLDEPTSGLDPVGRRDMLDLVAEIGKRGISVVLSTHLLHDVEHVCDAVVLLDHGKLALQGRLDGLRQRQGWVYEVRVREERPGGFRDALTAKGCGIEEDLDGLLRVTVEPSAEVDGGDTRSFFEIARGVSAEIRHLRRYEQSLEQQFLSAVDEPRGGSGEADPAASPPGAG